MKGRSLSIPRPVALAAGAMLVGLLALAVYIAVSVPHWLFGAHGGGPGGRALAIAAGAWIAFTAALVTLPILRDESLRSYRVVAVAASAMLLIGTLIFHRGWMVVYTSQKTSGLESITDSLYHTFRLFEFKGVDSPPGGVGTVTHQLASGWQLPALWIIVFGAPVVTLGALVTVVRNWQELKFVLRRRHTVLIGAGDRGMAFIRDVPTRWPRAWWRRTIVVDVDTRFRDLVQDRGCDFLQDDARSLRALRLARVRRAGAVLISTGSKPLNADIARLAIAEAGARGGNVVFHTKTAELLPTSLGEAEPYDHDLILCRRVVGHMQGANRIAFVVDSADPFVRSMLLATARGLDGQAAEDPADVRLVGSNVIALRSDLMVEPVVLSSRLQLDAVDVELPHVLVNSDDRARLAEAVRRFEPDLVILAAGSDDLTHAVSEIISHNRNGGRVVRIASDVMRSASDDGVGDVTVVPCASSSSVLDAVRERRERLVAPLALTAGGVDLRHGLSTHTPRALEPALDALLADETDVRGLLNAHACGVSQIDGPEVWAEVATRLGLSEEDGVQRFIATCEAIRSSGRKRSPDSTQTGCPRCESMKRLREKLHNDPVGGLLIDIARVAHFCEDLSKARDSLRSTLRDWPTPDPKHVAELVSAIDSGARLLIIAGCAGAQGGAGVDLAGDILTNALAEQYELSNGTVRPRSLPDLRRLVVVGPGTNVGVGAALNTAIRGLRITAADEDQSVYAVVPHCRTSEVDEEVATIGIPYPEGHPGEYSILDSLLLWAGLLSDVESPDRLISGTSFLSVVSGRLMAPCHAGPPTAGRITLQEMEIARALGVPRIAWVDLDFDRDARERNAIIGDLLPSPVGDVLPLPPDRMTVRAWLHEQPAGHGLLGGPLAHSQQLSRAEIERLGEQIHHAYINDQRAEGRLETDPAMAPWSRLTGALRASNLAAARDWIEKVAALPEEDPSNLIASTQDGRPPHPQAMLNLFAELEHGRYVLERTSAGWSFGDRSIALQRTHALVPWAELSEQERAKDRRAVLVCAAATRDHVMRPTARTEQPPET